MKKKLMQWVEHLLGLLIAWAWKKYGQPRLEKAVAENMTVTVAHKQVPVAALAPLADAMPHIVKGLNAGKTPEEIYADLKAHLGDTALDVVEGVLNVFFPGVGTIMKVIVFMVEHTVPMTQEQENDWFSRFGAGAES